MNKKMKVMVVDSELPEGGPAPFFRKCNSMGYDIVVFPNDAEDCVEVIVFDYDIAQSLLEFLPVDRDDVDWEGDFIDFDVWLITLETFLDLMKKEFPEGEAFYLSQTSVE